MKVILRPSTRPAGSWLRRSVERLRQALLALRRWLNPERSPAHRALIPIRIRAQPRPLERTRHPYRY